MRAFSYGSPDAANNNNDTLFEELDLSNSTTERHTLQSNSNPISKSFHVEQPVVEEPIHDDSETEQENLYDLVDVPIEHLKIDANGIPSMGGSRWKMRRNRAAVMRKLALGLVAGSVILIILAVGVSRSNDRDGSNVRVGEDDSGERHYAPSELFVPGPPPRPTFVQPPPRPADQPHPPVPAPPVLPPPRPADHPHPPVPAPPPAPHLAPNHVYHSQPAATPVVAPHLPPEHVYHHPELAPHLAPEHIYHSHPEDAPHLSPEHVYHSQPSVEQAPHVAPSHLYAPPHDQPHAETRHEPVEISELRFKLKEFGVEDLDNNLEDPRSAQYRALSWLAMEDKLHAPEMTDEDADFVLTRYAMAVLYLTDDGQDWKSNFFLKAQESICEWGAPVGDTQAGMTMNIGLKCSENNLPMTLMMNGNDIKGPIPTEIGFMTDLLEISLRDNKLQGSIPTEICKLNNLLVLDLGENVLTGAVPDCLGEMTDLEALALNDNTLDGKLPREIENMSKLRELILSENQFRDNLHLIIRDLTNLEWLLADNNFFDGDIQLSLRNLDKLKVFDVSNNNLYTRAFPERLFELAQLEQVDFSNNRDETTGGIMGQFPSKIDLNTRMAFLSFDACNMTGPIPNAMANLTALKSLHLSDNFFSGYIPDFFGFLKKLEYLMMGKNDGLYPEGFPEGLRYLRNLKGLSLRETEISGPLPTWLGELTELKYLDLDSNSFDGNVPVEWERLTNLEYLFLSRNPGLKGDPSHILAAMGNLREVTMDGTEFSGDMDKVCDSMHYELNGQQKSIIASCASNLVDEENCKCCNCCDPTDWRCSAPYTDKADQVFTRVSWIPFEG